MRRIPHSHSWMLPRAQDIITLKMIVYLHQREALFPIPFMLSGKWWDQEDKRQSSHVRRHRWKRWMLPFIGTNAEIINNATLDQTMNLFIKILQCPGLGIRWFPSPFAPENVASKIHTSFDSLPNGSLGYLIHWSLTKTIALVLSFLNMSSLWRIPKITLKYIRSIWNLIFPKNIILYFLCEVVSAHFIDESREWALKTILV